MVVDKVTGYLYNTGKPFSDLKVSVKPWHYHKDSTDVSHYYVAKDHKDGIVIKDIDVNGTEKFKEILTDIKVVTIFLRVPKDELKRRLENRIDKLSHEQITLRLNRFDYEESKMNIYDYVMKNDDLEKALAVIQTIIEQEYAKEQRELNK
jgi:guanylate kinase